ncbi:hypothetical protein [Polaribacter cellanae]|uniref:Uncharacterized protein n=1 Tax=Polaribacter cellanae TaxID=2818493 RepID=A0A975CTD9_9FLAO|nr:hypothetical protein [Polaribacter cellanae]QTE23006.1 hypothetical protein J3359_01655 [Polaribacter cellanae]
MKKILFFTAILIGFNTVAQSKKIVLGSKAKNYKYWKHKKVSTVIKLNTLKHIDLKGSEAKNLKIWNRKKSETKIVLAKKTKIRKLIGPKAKNHKPWQN